MNKHVIEEVVKLDYNLTVSELQTKMVELKSESDEVVNELIDKHGEESVTLTDPIRYELYLKGYEGIVLHAFIVVDIRTP